MTGLHGLITEGKPARFCGDTLCSDDRFMLTLHGRIDNLSTLRAHVPDAGGDRDDAATLLCLWRQQGISCLPTLDGAFALALWDAHERTLTLARDRFGLKPLYYALHADGMAFGARAAELAPRRVAPDLNTIFHYLTVQSIPAPFSAFQGVRQLQHGHSLVWKQGQEARIQRYWTPRFTHGFDDTLDEAATTLHQLLRAALHRHADLSRAGVLLSGGVDSSLMTALLCEAGYTPQTFAVGFAEAAFDERPFARSVAAQYHTQHHELECPADLPALVETIVNQFGQPFADSSALPTWIALHAVRQAGLDAALLGDGGDDLFAGYERHLNPFLYSGADTEDARAAGLRSELDGYPQFAGELVGLQAANAKFYTHWARFWGPLKNEVCGEALRRAADPPATLLLAQGLFQPESAHNLLDAIQCFELDYYLPCTLATKVEIPARDCNLVTIAPFLSNAVADFALQLPPDLRVGACTGLGSYGRGVETKRTVKHLAERFLPKELVYRRKMGFGVPLALWLRGPLRELLRDTLLGRTCRERGWLAPHTVSRLVHEHLQGVRDWHYPLWALLMLELWAVAFMDSSPQQSSPQALRGLCHD